MYPHGPFSSLTRSHWTELTLPYLIARSHDCGTQVTISHEAVRTTEAMTSMTEWLPVVDLLRYYYSGAIVIGSCYYIMDFLLFTVSYQHGCMWGIFSYTNEIVHRFGAICGIIPWTIKCVLSVENRPWDTTCIFHAAWMGCNITSVRNHAPERYKPFDTRHNCKRNWYKLYLPWTCLFTEFTIWIVSIRLKETTTTEYNSGTTAISPELVLL